MFREPQVEITRHYFGANPSIPDAEIRSKVQQLPYPIDFLDVSPIMHHMLSPARVSAIVGFGSRPLQWNALTDDGYGSPCSSPPYQLCNPTYRALACLSAWRLARAVAANTNKFSLSVDKILLTRVVRENRVSIDLSRHWGVDLGVGGERAQMDGGATDNQTELIHYMRAASYDSRARSLCDNTRDTQTREW